MLFRCDFKGRTAVVCLRRRSPRAGCVKGLICERRSRVIWYRLQLCRNCQRRRMMRRSWRRTAGVLQYPVSSHDISDNCTYIWVVITLLIEQLLQTKYVKESELSRSQCTCVFTILITQNSGMSKKWLSKLLYDFEIMSYTNCGLFDLVERCTS